MCCSGCIYKRKGTILEKQKTKKTPRASPKFYLPQEWQHFSYQLLHFPKLLKKLSKPQRKRTPSSMVSQKILPGEWTSSFLTLRNNRPCLYRKAQATGLVQVAHQCQNLRRRMPQTHTLSTEPSFYLFQREILWSCHWTPDRIPKFLIPPSSAILVTRSSGHVTSSLCKGISTHYKWETTLTFMGSLWYQTSNVQPPLL